MKALIVIAVIAVIFAGRIGAALARRVNRIHGRRAVRRQYGAPNANNLDALAQRARRKNTTTAI